MRSRARTIQAALVRGRRVYLRHAAPGDRAEWCALRDTSRAFHRPWEPNPPPGSGDSSQARFVRLLETSDLPENQRHLICRRADERIVGMVNLSQIYRGPFCNAIMGYWLGEPFTGKGYMTDAVRLTLRRAFGELKLHRVEANVMPENESSLALVRRAGFREEGYSPRYLRIAGKWRDHVGFAMTKEDWRALGRQPK